jgi:hypothetical protein
VFVAVYSEGEGNLDDGLAKGMQGTPEECLLRCIQKVREEDVDFENDFVDCESVVYFLVT